MRLDSKHALRHVLCLPNLSAMQGAKWESVDTKRKNRRASQTENA